MRTVLCTRAGRLGLGLVLVTGLGAAVALPAASAAVRSPASQSRPATTAVVSQQSRSASAPAVSTQSRSASAPAVSTVHRDPQPAAVLAPAVKYVRDADGTIRQVR